MGDSRLLELKRAWVASGNTEDGAAYLLERVRVGDLSKDRLDLAAWCGHAAAELASGRVAPSGVDFWQWCMDLATWCEGVPARLAAIGISLVPSECFEVIAPEIVRKLSKCESLLTAWPESPSARDKLTKLRANLQGKVSSLSIAMHQLGYLSEEAQAIRRTLRIMELVVRSANCVLGDDKALDTMLAQTSAQRLTKDQEAFEESVRGRLAAWALE